MDGEHAFAQLRDQTNAWVASVAQDYVARLRMPKKNDVKTVRDGVTGYQVLRPHEYLVLDHPIVQRLRYIHQTAFAYLVYPTANHTRFDHSLGCARIAQDIGNRLISQDRARMCELRLAALLHDVGHAFFSHLSETIMESHFREFYLALKDASQFRGLNLRLSEMMSYMIVKSEPFDDFLRRVALHYEPTLDLNTVADLIRHKPTDSLAFMGDIISGAFDIDKLDYLVRDCYFTGIRADVDVERVVVSASLLDPDRFPTTDPRRSRRSLVMLTGGISILEQIAFNKMLLFPAIYHHHKVRAIECMVKSVFERIWDMPEHVEDVQLRFGDVLDFYKLTEPEFLALPKAETMLRPIIERLLNRDLLERCLVLFPRYAKDASGWKHLAKRHYEDNPGQIRWLRELILAELPSRVRRELTIYDLWVDIPKSPDLGDPDRALVDIGTTELVPLSKFFPYPHWLLAYESNKLKGHVFSVSDPKIRVAVNKAAQKVLREQFGLEFEARATQECKLNTYS